MTESASFPVLPEPFAAREPRPAFRRRLRDRLVDDLGLTPDIALPDRRSTMPTRARITTAVAVPYLAIDDGAAAIAWYSDVFDAAEQLRVVGDDGRVGHAELSIGGATLYLADEYPEYGVTGPRTLGGTSVTIHLTVDDVDTVFAHAVERGANAISPLADQPHGARHGTIVDPFGHRWLLSQQIEQVDLATYRDRAGDDGYTVRGARPVGQIWATVPYADAPAGIRFLTEVLGFEPQIVVPNPDDPTVIEHSQLAWPEGGILQASTANRPGNPYSQRPPGSESLYVVTANPEAVWHRCEAAGVEVVEPLRSPDYAPDTTIFSIRDPEGNIFSFGSYAGEG